MVTFIVLITIICLSLITALIWLSLKDNKKDMAIEENETTYNWATHDRIKNFIKNFGYTPTTINYMGNDQYKIFVTDNRIDYILYKDPLIHEPDSFTMYAFIGHNNHSLIINQLIDLNELSGVLISSVNLVNEVDNRFNIKSIEYTDYSMFYCEGLIINTDSLSFIYNDNILTIDNDLIEVNKQYHPNNFNHYIEEFNQRVKFFYEDVAEYINDTKEINGYTLTFDKDTILAVKGFNKHIIFYDFKINAYKGTVDIYRDNTNLETKNISNLSDIHSIITENLDKKVNKSTVDIRI